MNKEDCEVSSNCMKSYDCDWCKDYNEYSPINRNILSPAQKQKKEKKKAERKIKNFPVPVKEEKQTEETVVLLKSKLKIC